MAHIEAKGMANLRTWATEVKMFSWTQLAGKDSVCYYLRGWLKRPTRSALFIANKSGVQCNPVIGML